MKPKAKKRAKPAKKKTPPNQVKVHVPHWVLPETNARIKAELTKNFGATPLPEASGREKNILQFENQSKTVRS